MEASLIGYGWLPDSNTKLATAPCYSIAAREAKLIDRRRKLEQSAAKQSLFYRTLDGDPIVPDEVEPANFPVPNPTLPELESDIALALASRPELAALDLLARRTGVDLAEACNDMLPSIDAQLVGSQDVGEPTSKKRDKSEFELEAGLFFDVPVQRRKARGKIRAARPGFR